MDAPSVSIDREPPYPSLRQTWWPMLLMFLAANLYNIDKAIVGILAEQIRKALVINDVQMGLLLGLAYSLLSGLLGLVLGYLVDRNARRTILAFSIILWSVSTVAGGLAPNFHWFFAFRALVGLGEAAVAPCSISLIADMFPPHRRGRALGSYLFGGTMGTALSSIIPGWILGHKLSLSVPMFGVLPPWRTAFVLCGAVGPIVGLLLVTVREPARRGLPAASRKHPPLSETLSFLWEQRRIIVPLYSGFCLHYVAFVGIISWTATFLTRTYSVSLAAFAGRLGVMMLIAGGSGYLVGGLLADSKPITRPGRKLLLLAGLPILGLVSALAGLAPDLTGAVLMLTSLSFATPILNVAMNASVQDLVPNRMRGFSYALLSVVGAIPAGVGGPLAIAYASQYLVGGPSFIGRSFIIVGVPALLAASALFLLAWRAFRTEVKSASPGAAPSFSQA